MHATFALHDSLGLLSMTQPVTLQSRLDVPEFAGWELKNTRLMADKFASKGFIVAIPGIGVDKQKNEFAIQRFHKKCPV